MILKGYKLIFNTNESISRVLPICHLVALGLLISVFSGCVQQNRVYADPTESKEGDNIQAFGEKCENAKYQLEQAVEEGQTTNLRDLKYNIELHCVWRRN